MSTETVTSNKVNDSNVKHIGERILYVEPNDVYGEYNGIPITPDYSDLCISFDLVVETVPRTGYTFGNYEKKEGDSVITYHISWCSYEKNKNGKDNYVSFTKGTEYGNDSYMTTYYTDINFNDFAKKDIVEGLGVESVNISFESYYVPTIKIRFIDVRGATMFGRQEAIHRNEQITQDSIWGCFFTFPYPRFMLQVKGFYGHAVTYQLTCTDFRANFNGTTGNFEIDVTFLGYDYGILADIPTAYLIAAPLSKYVGHDYWEQHKTDKSWQMSDGNTPNTLSEILHRISSTMRYNATNENGVSYSDGDDGEDYIDKEKEYSLLKDSVLPAYNKFLDRLNNPNVSGFAHYSKREQKEMYRFLLDGNEYYLFEPIDNNSWSYIKRSAIDFYNAIAEFKKNYNDDGTKFDNEQLIFGREITNDTFFSTISQDVFTGVLNMTSSNFAVIRAQNAFGETVSIPYEKINDSFEVKEKGVYKQTDIDKTNFNSKNGYQIVYLGKTKEIIKKLMDSLSASKAQEDVEYEAQQDETDSYFSRLKIYEAAGLTPTIENVFRTILCHLETFTAMVYKCEENINKQITAGDRTPEKLGLSQFSMDTAKNETNDKSKMIVPPWPAVSVDERKEGTSLAIEDSVKSTGWVGDFDGSVEWEEVKLIEGLSLAWVNSQGESDTSGLTLNGTAEIYCLSGDVISDVFPDEATKNPCSLGEYLGIRASAMFGVAGYDGTASKALGIADAINLYSKVGKEAINNSIIKWNGWADIIKKAPTEFSNYESVNRVYTVNPGCEGRNAVILAKNDDTNYRYTYTESVVNRTPNNMKGDSRCGMVPVVEGGMSSVIGSEDNPKIFISESKGDKYRDIKPYQSNGKVGKIYHAGTSNTFIALNRLSEEDINGNRYTNDVMYNIYGGGLYPDYVDSLMSQYTNLNQTSLLVGNYKDTDVTWRNVLKEYWHMKRDYENDYKIIYVTPEDYYFTVTTVSSGGESSHDFIFYSPLYYCQNEIENEKQRMAAKCILFLSSAGYDYDRVHELFVYGEDSMFREVPYGAVLLMGAYLWRAAQPGDKNTDIIKVPNDYKAYNLRSIYAPLIKTEIADETGNVIRKYILRVVTKNSPGNLDQPHLGLGVIDANITSKLISEFEYFLHNVWPYIHDEFELKNDNDHETLYHYENFNEWLTSDQFSEQREKKINNENRKKITDYCSDILNKPVFLVRGTLNRQHPEDTEVIFDKGLWEDYVSSFCSKLEEIANAEEATDENVPIESKRKDTDLKLAMYMYIKRLWDRWFRSCSKEQFKVSEYMKHFIFMDSLYRNIGNVLHINCELLYECLAHIDGDSMLYQLLGNITDKHNCHFFGFPDYFGFGDDEIEQANATVNDLTPEAKIADLFVPIPYSRKEKLSTSNKFIVMLIYNQSENISDFNDYRSDSFDIFSNDDTILPVTFKTPAMDESVRKMPVEDRRVNRYGYNIPSFGVAFGRQNNHIFKNISIGMTNPIATEQSINALTIVAERGGGSDKAVCFYGQDLYPVYNGYSYTCTVEMMGNAQIMPLMYFQLLNIPTFRGTYMIYSVQHSMRPGDMTTTFKAMKLSRNALPFTKGWFTTSKIYIGGDGEFYDGVYREDACDSTWDSKYFTYSQMLRTSKAGSNTPNTTEKKYNIKLLLNNCLDKIRDIYGKDIIITSGYRSREVNAQIEDASNTSQHMEGQAADIQPKATGKKDLNELHQLFEAALKFGDFDQLIWEHIGEKGPWIHVSYTKNRRRHQIRYTRDGDNYPEITRENWKNYAN